VNVKIADGKATIPLWAAIMLIVTILLATAGWVALAAEKANAIAHDAIDLRLNRVEKAIELIPEMQKDIAVIAALLSQKAVK